MFSQGKYLVFIFKFYSQMSIGEYFYLFTFILVFSLIIVRKIRRVNFMLKVKNESRLSHYTNEVIPALRHG